MNRITFFSAFLMIVVLPSSAMPDAMKWKKYELVFTSTLEYENPVQDLRSLEVTFTSPTGTAKTINAFWDGGKTWKARFMPWETGTWSFVTACSDQKNTGLHDQKGTFLCRINNEKSGIYTHGPIINPEGTYHLAHADGTPFFYLACTAWNGALKSTEEEWEYYLQHRVKNNYTAIQLVTTQWRGCDKSSEGLAAFEGSGRIRINPEFFRVIDERIDRVNDHGLVVMPIVLWALQSGQGRELSPGYYLPDDQAIILARYIVARYNGNHVIWALGGDGSYIGTYEQRWKTIGRAVFDGKYQGLVAQHPQGRSWIGEVYKDEPWLDIVGYQSSHSNTEPTVNWITKGPMSEMWHRLPARPLINLEPNYEQIGMRITDKDVRNASWWSIFATPVSGVTYGANGIWPWLRKGEKILNHGNPDGTSTWRESLDFPGSLQAGYLAGFIKQFRWWELYPSQSLLVEQPGNKQFNHFVSVVRSLDNSIVIAYIPVKQQISIRKPMGAKYRVRWFDPVTNTYTEGSAADDGQVITVTPPAEQDMVLILKSS
jgi:hypothetical protein